MSLGEFELIRRFFTRPADRADVLLGAGDDCALVSVPTGRNLAITVDSLVEGIHFLAGTDPENLGHKSLAVSLSDLAAMGASPAWATLALTLPEANEAWLAAFAKGFLSLADRFGVALVGGDTTRGPLSISVQAMGFASPGNTMRRAGAKPGDGIYLTGDLGLAGLGLEIVLGNTGLCAPEAVHRLERPEPRVHAGMALAGLANACIDVSDGLAADLGHILSASGVGASLSWVALPIPSAVRRYIGCSEGEDWMPLTAGDDYELCFTVPSCSEAELAGRLVEFDCSCVRIGRIEEQSGLRLVKDGQIVNFQSSGFQHFRGSTANG